MYPQYMFWGKNKKISFFSSKIFILNYHFHSLKNRCILHRHDCVLSSYFNTVPGHLPSVSLQPKPHHLLSGTYDFDM